jgi:very-short-patch-repair endonuclease
MRRDIDEQLQLLAARQDNVFSRDQAEAAGAGPNLRYRRVVSGMWVPVGAAGYRFAAAPLTWRGRVRASVWDGGPRTLVSHAAAAQLYHFPGFTGQEAHILVPKSLDHVCTIATVHESRRFDMVRSQLMFGMPVVAKSDTIVHVARHLTHARLAWLTDELLFAKRVELRGLNEAFGRLGPGCAGLGGLRAVLTDHAPGEPVPESELERLFLSVAISRHLPPFRRQVNVPGREQRPARVDFLWPDVKLIVEVDGRRWHARFADFERDHKRDLQMLAMGYRTARITWSMLVHDADDVCADLLAARAAVA